MAKCCAGLALIPTLRSGKRLSGKKEMLLEREQQARLSAESANRIKDEFLAVVSHELRTPLNPILGWSQLLQKGKLSPEKADKALQIISRSAKTQAQLIDDLLDVSRILRGKLSLNASSVDLAAIVRAALETVQLSAMAKSIKIYTMFDQPVGQISGDASRLQQVIWNLLSNAVKFTPEGGRIDITLESVNGYAQIAVSDTGKGIDPEFVPYVFDHFRQEDGTITRQFGGLGLGLAIVRQLVELHGGTVRADSVGEGRGATFTVRLPLLAPLTPLKPSDQLPNQLPNQLPDQSLDSSLNQTQSQSSGQQPSLAHATAKPLAPSQDLQGVEVLVVEDDQSSRDYIASALEAYGASVMVVDSANAALAYLTDSTCLTDRMGDKRDEDDRKTESYMQPLPDVLLSDIGMPEMNGYELMRQVRRLPVSQGGKVRAIALTAYAGELDYRAAMAAGFQRHITKPVEPHALVEAIASLLK